MSLRTSPLDTEHRALGARMVAFGEWEMPLHYAGVLQEHRACREHVAIFDVSHLASIRVNGRGAAALVQSTFTNNLDRIRPGRSQYTLLLDPQDAHVVDDLVVWWVDDDELIAIANAANVAAVLDALVETRAAIENGNPPIDDIAINDLAIDDLTPERALLAVQGPKARALLEPILPEAVQISQRRTSRIDFGTERGYAAGTGYTGEDGVELHVPSSVAGVLWRQLIGAGATPAGLGARDTLRLEAGLPLHGHELGPGITPLHAGLEWAVDFVKPDFRGRQVLLDTRDRGIDRRLQGLLVDGRQIPRAGCSVLQRTESVGTVTSGNLSPMLQRGIALALLRPDIEVGASVTIDIRGRSATATVVDPPFA